MVKCQVVMDVLEQLAPKRLAEDWDNPGLLVGALNQNIRRILVCLDVSDKVVEQAVACQADMIVAHHPLIFKGLKKIRTDLPLGARLQQLQRMARWKVWGVWGLCLRQWPRWILPDRCVRHCRQGMCGW